MGYGSNEFNVQSPTVMESAGFTPGLGLHSLPGVGLVTWTEPDVISWCLQPYALLGLSLPGGVRLVTWTILAVVN